MLNMHNKNPSTLKLEHENMNGQVCSCSGIRSGQRDECAVCKSSRNTAVPRLTLFREVHWAVASAYTARADLLRWCLQQAGVR